MFDVICRDLGASTIIACFWHITTDSWVYWSGMYKH